VDAHRTAAVAVVLERAPELEDDLRLARQPRQWRRAVGLLQALAERGLVGARIDVLGSELLEELEQGFGDLCGVLAGKQVAMATQRLGQQQPAFQRRARGFSGDLLCRECGQGRDPRPEQAAAGVVCEAPAQLRRRNRGGQQDRDAGEVRKPGPLPADEGLREGVRQVGAGRQENQVTSPAAAACPACRPTPWRRAARPSSR
jgi:hypothetical protein